MFTTRCDLSMSQRGIVQARIEIAAVITRVITAKFRPRHEGSTVVCTLEGDPFGLRVTHVGYGCTNMCFNAPQLD